MSDVAAFLGRLVEALEAAGVPYMLAGSFASTFHGTPRTTQDIDIVVELAPASVVGFLGRLPEEDVYVSLDAARDAIRRRSQFNIIDLESGWKADLIVKKDRPFSDAEFGRRQRANILGVDVWLASAEDTILSKLEWAKKGGSERQLRDVGGILDLRGGELDRAYLDTWAKRLDVQQLWQQALASFGQ